VNVIGIGRKTGKTHLVRELLEQLRKQGFRISTIKHIAEGSFDTAYKDTWQHLQAGAVQVTALSSNEQITIKRVASPSLDEVLKTLSGNSDMILVEGFKASRYPKIIVARTIHEVDELIRKTSNIIAISGSILEEQPHLSSYQGISLLRLDALVPLLVQRFHAHEVSRLPHLNCGRCGYGSCDQMAHAIMHGDAVITQCKALFDQNIQLAVNGMPVSLSAFPAVFIRNTVLGMIATLHGARAPKRVTLNIQLD
jgi:molybdopterin-guanine dinucleotide biosynthesis protein B